MMREVLIKKPKIYMIAADTLKLHSAAAVREA
jgi:hypothetical protein